MNAKKIYISGKISGLPFPQVETKFRVAEIEVHKMGYSELINPTMLVHEDLNDWDKCMVVDIMHLFKCDAIYMLKDWKESKGARIEHSIAIETNKTIIYQK